MSSRDQEWSFVYSVLWNSRVKNKTSEVSELPSGLFVSFPKGGLLKIVYSRSWFFIRLQFAINVFLRSCTAGWYVVTKGNSLSLLFCFCFSDCPWSKLTSDNDLSISSLEYPSASRRLKFARLSSNVFFWKVCSKQSYCFALCILKGFSRLIVGFDVQGTVDAEYNEVSLTWRTTSWSDHYLSCYIKYLAELCSLEIN